MSVVARDQEPLFDIRGLTKSYGPVRALEDVSMQIAEGEKVVIIGRSGSGKSTLLEIVSGQLDPDAGRVLADGEDVCRLGELEKDAYRKAIGIAFQYGGLLASMTLADNVALPLRYHTDLPEPMIRIMVRLKLELVGLRAWADRYPHELSGGMLKRAGIAGALSMDPRVIFYDEPTGGLDPVTAARIDALMVELNEGLGVTSVIVTHSLDTARRVADRVVLLEAGRLVAEGTPDALWASNEALVQQFLHGRTRGPLTEGADVGGYHDDLLSAARMG